MDITGLIRAARAGRRRDLARLLSIVESGSERDVRTIVGQLHADTGGAHTIGVTGPPGVGKSTLTAGLVETFRARGSTVAVLAVDPSSPFSGGALLGDRVRMGAATVDDGVFVRSMASRGQLGGLSAATPSAMTVLDAVGFDVVIVETVGVGQAEVEIASLADTTLVVLAPGMGDAVQAAKAGILEVADVFVVNKDDREGADRTAGELQAMQGLAADRAGWTPPICRTVAPQGTGVDALADAITAHLAWAIRNGRRQQHRRRAISVHIREIVVAAVRRRIRDTEDGELLDGLVDAVVSGQIDPYEAADQLLGAIDTPATASGSAG